jgi:ABC-type antimicrobial peptide transport system permease subunit
VAAHDPITLIGVVMLTSTVGSLALYVAARRAARIDPVIALRQ